MLFRSVSVMTKVATQKTAGVLGDDLALNAQQVAGVAADRELPVVWAVAKGSAINKMILVPAALAISALEYWLHSKGINIPLITPLMMAGGAFLCFEGVEKIAHKFLHDDKEEKQHHKDMLKALVNDADLVAFEKDKIKGAIRTDFILSAEIIVITLGTVAHEAFSRQITVLTLISIIMTIGVYGLVAGIVKLDDGGGYLLEKKGVHAWARFQQSLGKLILWFAPFLMKTLSIAGTAAMFLVGGSILVHSIPAVQHFVQGIADKTGGMATLMAWLGDAVVGILAGIVVLLAVLLFKKIVGSKKPAATPQ